MLQNALCISQKQQVNGIDGIWDYVLVESGRNKFADLREHTQNQIFKFYVFKKFGAVFNNYDNSMNAILNYILVEILAIYLTNLILTWNLWNGIFLF